ncbi:hypothetical protein CPC08DRAFT_752398 [Agrocybe pediades]|nr:hypothetical protein CPC08DRAFT_752398 [Agrocybe pediades]
MTKVDGELAAMATLSLPDPDKGGMKFVMGQILQSTKSIMDKVADAHPFVKVAWSALAFVYEAFEKTTLEDKAVRDLAESLREMLGVASARRDLLVIKDTVNVIEEMSLLALRIAQVLHEYCSPRLIARTIRLNMPASSLHARIQQYQAAHNELMKKFDRRLQINVDVQVDKVYQTVQELKIAGGGIESQTSVRLFRPIATTRFIGRQKEMEELKAHFEIRDTSGARRQTTSGARHSFLISGMGGIGKTQLCLQFVEDAMDNSTFSRVFYVDAATEESIASSFKGIFHNTQGLKSSGLSESPDSVLAWISRLEEDWLIVYDNAEESVAKYLPGGRRGNILMTSRNPGLARHTGGAHIALDEMTEEDALALFKASGCHEILSPEDERLSRDIVSSLSFIPLAVDLAGAYTASFSGFCDLHEYLELLSVKRAQVLNPISIADATPYNNTIYGAWELSMKGLEDVAASSHARQEAAQSALAILQIFSFFHHSVIDENIFKRAAVAYHTASAHENDFFCPPMLSSVALKILQLDGTKNDWDNGYFRKGIQMLLSASLIKKSTMSERVVYSVHPLIHEWVRNKYIPHDQALPQDAHIIMLSSISLFDNVHYQKTITPLLPHIKAYQQYTLDQILINQEYNDYIFRRLRFFYGRTSLFGEEKKILPIMIEQRKQALGENKDTLSSMHKLAICLKNQGKLVEAEEMYSKVIALRTKILGDDHPSTLTSRSDLGSLYMAKGQWEEAKAIILPILEARTRVFGGENMDTLDSIHNLALCLENQGKLVEAEEMYSKKIAGGGVEAQTSVRLFRPIATSRFVGRVKEMGKLKAHFKIRDTSGARHSFLISGMGGIGKTQLCLQFVEDAMDNSTFSRVFYVDAATEESIASSFKGIFHNTQDLKSSGLSESPDSVLAWISRLEEDWLIVYDNAEESVAKYLPGGRRGNILMTSRNPGLARHTGGAHIALDEMTEEDALALFKASGCHEILSPEDERLSRDIVSSLSFIPLAVDLAGAYTASFSGFCDLHEYLELLSVKRAQVLNPISIADATPYNNTIYGAWELSMKGLEDVAASSHARQEAAQSALAILQIFSFFHHSVIDENIFKRAAVAYHTASAHENDFFCPPMLSSVALKILQLDGTKNDWDNGYFRKGIQMLLSASLIKKSTMSERVVYSVHPLIHEWVRNKYIPHDQALPQDAHIIMLSSISLFDNVHYQKTITPLLPHIKAYQQYTLDQILINQEYNDYIFRRLRFFYGRTSLFGEEKKILPIMIEQRKQALGENKDTLSSMHKLAICLKNQGKLVEAEEMYSKVIALRTKILGDDHPSTLTSRSDLGSLYMAKGQWEEAKAIILPILEARTRGDDHPSTLTSRRNLGSLYMAKGQWEEAKAILLSVVEARTRIFGEENMNTLSSMHVLARCLNNQGKLAEAEEMYSKVIVLQTKILGYDHPSTLTSRHNLGSLYTDKGQWEEAKAILLLVVEARTRVFGEENMDTLSSMDELAHCLDNQGKLAEAEEMYSKVIAHETKILGYDHPSTLTSRHNLGSLYAEHGQLEKAEVMLIPVVEARTRVLGNNHDHTLMTRKWLERVQRSRTSSECDDDAEGMEDSTDQSAFDSDDDDEGEEEEEINDASGDEEEEERAKPSGNSSGGGGLNDLD